MRYREASVLERMRQRVDWTGHLRSAIWKARSADLVWRTWEEGEYLVYDAASGDTHVLDSLAAASLRQLESAALSHEELMLRLGEVSAQGVDGLSQQIAGLLTRFDQLGLIEPAA